MSSSVEDLPITEEDLVAAICREDLWFFAQEFWETIPGAGKMVPNWHMEVLCRELQVVAERVFAGLPKLHDLVVNVPPGTSKSSLVSILFPAWLWTRMPEARVLSASNTDNLVLDLSTKARAVIKSDKYRMMFPDVILREDVDAKGRYANTCGGDRVTCTVSGKSPIGMHAHFICIDDPIDPKRASSEVELQIAKEFVTEHIVSRKVDKAVTVTILVMQRLAPTDPSAVMLGAASKEGAAPVRHLCLPSNLIRGDDGAWLEGDVSPVELAKNYVDGLLDPKRMSWSVIREFQAKGAHYFETQFRQKAYARQGGLFRIHDFNKRIRAAPYECRRIRYWDRACLLPGVSLVTTARGDVPIDRVLVGDQVLTRRGYQVVRWAGPTKSIREVTTVLCTNGELVAGTADHLVWTENRGWVELASLHGQDILVTPDGEVRPELVRSLSVWDTQGVDGVFDPVLEALDRYDGSVPVFDLEVGGVHEFYTNSILVHNSTAGGGCYTAGVLLAKDLAGYYYVEHVVHGQWEPKQRNDIIKATALRDRVKYGKYEPTIYVEAEGGSSGVDAWMHLAKMLAGFRVRQDRPSGSKDVRAEPWAAQLAAGTVFIVDGDDTWSIQEFIDEHVRFMPDRSARRMGRYKDQVDSASAAFTLLSQQRQAGTVRVYNLGKKKKGALKIVVCTREELASLHLEDRVAVVVHFEDPEVGDLQRFLDGTQEEKETISQTTTRCLGVLHLRFTSLDPRDYQDTWNRRVEPYGRKPADLVMTDADGKRLWSFLLRPRELPVDTFILCEEDGNKRAMSVAYAICDILNVNKDSTVYVPSEPEGHVRDKVPPVLHIYEQTRRNRGLVV